MPTRSQDFAQEVEKRMPIAEPIKSPILSYPHKQDFAITCQACKEKGLITTYVNPEELHKHMLKKHLMHLRLSRVAIR